MKSAHLIGTWILKEFTLNKNKEEKPWGENVHGILIYNDDGYMSVAINSTTDVLFYTGTYDISNDNIIIHNVLNATDKQRIGNQMLRNASIYNNKLTLVSEGKFGIATLIWDKIIASNYVL